MTPSPPVRDRIKCWSRSTISTPASLTTNQLSGYTYDPNGNQISTGYAYDAENRLVQANAGGVRYGYDSRNKRIWQGNFSNSTGDWLLTSDSISVFGADGKMIGAYNPEPSWNNTQNQISIAFYGGAERVYFSGRLVAKMGGSGNLASIAQDRLESVGKYYPFGEERNSPPLANDNVKFATYTRDSATGLDYADQRYYANTFGRFTTPDPYRTSAGPSDPQSWNRYAYAESDPVNYYDPSGLLIVVPVYVPDWCYEFPNDPGCYEPVPIPLPTYANPPTCRMFVGTKGKPRDDQNIVGLAPYSPQTNTLGNYSTVNQPGYAPRFRGWFFAVQIQANLFEDTDPADWVATQTASTSGTLTIQPLGGPALPVPDNLSVHPDNPNDFAINQQTPGRFDWLDAPGVGKYQPAGGIVVGADVTKTYTSTLTNTLTGATCSVSWSLHLTGKGDKLSWSFQLK